MTVSYCNVLRRPLTGPSFFYLENILSLNMWPSMTGSFLSLLFHNIFWRRSKNVGKSSIWHRLDDVHFRTEMTTKMTWKEKVKYFRILFPGSRLAAKTKVVPADSPPFLWQTSLLNPGVPERLGTRLSVAGLPWLCVRLAEFFQLSLAHLKQPFCTFKLLVNWNNWNTAIWRTIWSACSSVFRTFHGIPAEESTDFQMKNSLSFPPNSSSNLLIWLCRVSGAE